MCISLKLPPNFDSSVCVRIHIVSKWRTVLMDGRRLCYKYIQCDGSRQICKQNTKRQPNMSAFFIKFSLELCRNIFLLKFNKKGELPGNIQNWKKKSSNDLLPPCIICWPTRLNKVIDFNRRFHFFVEHLKDKTILSYVICMKKLIIIFWLDNRRYHFHTNESVPIRLLSLWC